MQRSNGRRKKSCPVPPDPLISMLCRARAHINISMGAQKNYQHLPANINIETGGIGGRRLLCPEIGQDFFRLRLLRSVNRVSYIITYERLPNPFTQHIEDAWCMKRFNNTWRCIFRYLAQKPANSIPMKNKIRGMSLPR